MNKVPPGWNDPPPVPVNQSLGQSSKLRLLNKRVPFYFSNSNSPLPASEVSRINKLPESTQCESVTSSDINQVEQTIQVSKVIDKLIKVTEKVQDSNKKVDILKRLASMQKMWESNEINEQIQQQISSFADSLESHNIEQADNIYLTLTLNSALVCSSWIIAFKYILHNFKE